MTDEELKELVASLAVSQKKTDEDMKEMVANISASQRKTDEDMKEMVANISASQRKTDEQLARTDAQLAITDAQLAKTDAQLATTDAQLAKTDDQLLKTDAKLDKLAKMYGGVANNQGDVTEEFFFNSLKDSPVLNGIHFDFLERNVNITHKTLQDEFDILLINGADVFIIEVKYKAHEKDLLRLVDKKFKNFKKLLPLYKDYKHHLGLASFHINNKLKENALEQGVTVLQRKGDMIETTPGHSVSSC